MTLGELVALEPALDRLGSQPMPAKTRYHIARLIAAVRAETQHYAEQRNVIGQQYGEVQPDGNWSIAPDSPHLKTFLTKHRELADVEVTIDKWRLTYDILDTLSVSPNEELLLLPLIDEPK